MSEVALATANPVDEIGRDVAATKSLRRPRDRRRLWRLVVAANVVGLILLAVVLRCRGLGNLPGINGDEAWYGVQAELCLRGEPVAWRTPSGNLLNPFFFGPQLAMHAIFGPSFVVLRATAVASGLLALLLNFWLCRRVFGPMRPSQNRLGEGDSPQFCSADSAKMGTVPGGFVRASKIAIISTSILAVLPIDIAYSRLAWDASQSLLATLPCIYFPLWAINEPRWKIRLSAAAVAAMAIAIVVHPTNLFVVPIVIICLGYAWREKLLRVGRRTAWIAMLSGGVAVGVMAIVARPAWVGPAISRVANPPQYAAFVANVGRLLSGATVYEYVSGEMVPPASTSNGNGEFRSDCVPYDLAAWIIGGLVVCGLIRAARRNRPELICLAVGFGLSLFGFFLVAGPGALAPGFERYAIWMIGPAAVLASVALESWQEWRFGRVRSLSTIVAISLGWVLLFGFQTNCLGFLQQTGGRSHQTFRTAEVEPKQAALAYILAHREPHTSVRIVTSEWWIYWPMRYLSMGPRSSAVDSSVSVEPRSLFGSNTESLDLADVWFVEFTDSGACKETRNWFRNQRCELRETTISDFSGQPLLSMFAVGNQKKIKELDLTSRVDELGFLSRNDDQRDRRN